MSEAKMRADATAGFAAPPFHPILTDAGDGPIFTMLGTTMRLIATAAGTGGRYTVIDLKPAPRSLFDTADPAENNTNNRSAGLALLPGASHQSGRSLVRDLRQGETVGQRCSFVLHRPCC
jgi:hypothetical protein